MAALGIKIRFPIFTLSTFLSRTKRYAVDLEQRATAANSGIVQGVGSGCSWFLIRTSGNYHHANRLGRTKLQGGGRATSLSPVNLVGTGKPSGLTTAGFP
jgi:hypothetical protein